MMSMRRKAASPALSTKSPVSPQMNWRVDGSPYVDLCPPTPMWDNLPSISYRAQSPIIDNATEAHIAWSAYQNCSRRMNNACVANRAQSLEEQRLWWEETSSICRNAMLLHNATLCKQYHAETAKNLALLENANHVVLTMLDSFSDRQEVPMELPSNERSLSVSASSSTSDEIPEPVKRSRRLGISTLFDRVRDHLTIKDSRMEAERMTEPEMLLY